MEERGGSNTKQNEPSWEIEAENKPTHTNRKACKDGVFGVGGVGVVNTYRIFSANPRLSALSRQTSSVIHNLALAGC